MELLTIAKNVYRECSEFVHGNVIPELKKKNDKFSEEKKVKVLKWKLPKSANEQKSCIFKGFRSGWEW